MSKADVIKTIIENGWTKEAIDYLPKEKHYIREILGELPIFVSIKTLLSKYKIKVEDFSLSTYVKGSKTSMQNIQRDSSYTVRPITDFEKWTDDISRAFNYDKSIVEIERQVGEQYEIMHNNERIGYFGINVIPDLITVGTFTILPESRNSRNVMNSILAMRDEVSTVANNTGIRKIAAEVEEGKESLLGVYSRFGFIPDKKIEITTEFGQKAMPTRYSLVCNL